jgi:hypothetical protein
MKADRDASMDKLLAGTLKASRTEAREGTPEDTHLDAETLAAWADDALDVSERASAEAHAAGCARCQQLLAALVRTLPGPELKKSPWRMPSFGWLVPLTAAATALAIWVAVPKPSPVQVSSGETAVDAVTPAAPARNRSSAPADQPAANASAPAARADALQRQAFRQQGSPDPSHAGPVERDGADVRELDKDMKQESAEARAKTPALADSASNPARAETAVPIAPAAPPPAAQPTLRAAPAEAAGRVSAGAASSRMAFAPGLDVIVVSSNPSTRFRLLPGGGVQRSADAGSTWRTEVTGTTETLRAGSSPSPSVCWLVGGAGTVLLSIDGRTWRRVAFPENVDLLSVVASDQDNATVTTADGRGFVTTDGGQTWTFRPGL